MRIQANRSRYLNPLRLFRCEKATYLTSHRALDGCSTRISDLANQLVKPQNQKYFSFPEFRFPLYIARPVPLRRGVAHRHETLGAGCDGRRRRRVVDPPDETLPADGEVVWTWRRDPGVYPACLCGPGNGGNKGRSPG
jgi:hypothetical protein